MSMSPSEASLALVLVASAAACQDYAFAYRPPQRVVVTSVREVVINNADTDILFVVDNSGSMGEEQANLRRNARRFIEEVSLSENAYRVGIITTDALDETTPGLDGGRLRMRRATQNELNAAGCGIGPDPSPEPYLVRPALDDPALNEKRCRLVEDMVATVGSLGTQGSGREAGFLAVQKALDPTSEAGERNAGFFRPEADLAIIFMTDEEDCSLASYQPDAIDSPLCYEDIANALPVASFVTDFAARKGAAGVRKIRAALIGGGISEGNEGASFVPQGCRLVDDEPSSECGCWSSSAKQTFCGYLHDFGHACTAVQGCSVPRCDAMPSARYDDFLHELRRQRLAVSFPAGTFADSICRAEYDDTLLQIARTIVLSNCFIMEEAALGPDAVELVVRSPGPDGTPRDTVMPRFDAADATAECQSCADCEQGAWRYVDEHTVCLECGLKKEVGSEFILTVLNELRGVEE